MDVRTTLPWRYNEFLKPYMAGHPNSRILYHEFGPFDEWSYVVVRWLGGKRVQTMRDEGKLVFLTNDNRASMDRLLKQGYFDIVVSAYPDQLEHMLPDTKAMGAKISPPCTRFTTLKDDGFAISLVSK